MEELLELMSKKTCQYCAEKIPYQATLCTLCHRDQLNPILIVEQYLKVQIARYAIIIVALSIPLILLATFMKMWEVSAIAIGYGIVLFMIAMVYWLLGAFIIQFLPESLVNSKTPYLLQRVKVSRRAMYRNLLIYGAISAALVYVQFQLHDTRPKLSAFKPYIQTETPYTSKDIIMEVEMPLFTLHAIEKEEQRAIYIGIWNSFVPLNPALINDNPDLLLDHFKVVRYE